MKLTITIVAKTGRLMDVSDIHIAQSLSLLNLAAID
jgi:hypothetical protein